jgi:uncharacterized LabA/DUF88 family protein
MPSYLPPGTPTAARVMIFVDGENLAIRYKKLLDGREPPQHVVYKPDIFVWSHYCNIGPNVANVIRRYYFTSVGQDDLFRRKITDELKDSGIEAPRVFPKVHRQRTKRVDISLTTEMLSHAHRKNYDLAVLVAGDEDYVPLVEAVQAEGRRVVLWFLADGLSYALRQTSDFFYDIGHVLLEYDRSNLAYYHL